MDHRLGEERPQEAESGGDTQTTSILYNIKVKVDIHTVQYQGQGRHSLLPIISYQITQLEYSFIVHACTFKAWILFERFKISY